jgi:flavin-dependent dehydrogenase
MSNNGGTTRRIIGGGLSGLTAAINFAKNDESVEVHEARKDIGMQFHPNYQVLLKESPETPGSESDAKSYLNRWGLNPQFQYKDAKKFLCCTQKRDFTISLKEPLPLILRGGENSLERGLAKEAQDLGVDFHFKSRPKARPGDIMSAGSYRTDMAAFGAYYENSDFPRDQFLYMHDEKYSPRGWYLYIIPMDKDTIKVMNCCSKPHAKKVKKLLYKAVEERPVLRDIIDGAKPTGTVGGQGGVHFPRTAIKDGVYHTGEAAGFQDPWRGFGMNYAIESGVLAQRAISNSLDYDKLWKSQFKERKKADIARRGIFALLGNSAFEYGMRKIKDGDEVDWEEINPSGWKKSLIYNTFYSIEMAKKTVWDSW